MSWSITLIGSPAKVAEGLTAQVEKMEGQTKVEFTDALPHMVELVKQNFEPTSDPIIKITASGHGYVIDGEQKQRYFTCQIERIYGVIV